MSIAALEQVHTEVRRLAVAGSDLAAGDFRLKKLVPPLAKSAEKAPVFGKIVEAIEKVLGSNHETSPTALLELSSLVSSVLYTQGKTGAEGALEAFPPSPMPLSTSNTSARVLQPLIEALTSTGAGRLELVRDAHARGAFADLRLVRPALGALDDPYPEMADLVAKEVLPIYGRALLPELRGSYDPKGKGPHARRLELMSRLDREGTHPTVLEALEEGSKEVRLAALGCLEGRADAAALLLPQVKARAQEVRAAAYRALARIDRPEVVEALEAAIRGKDVELVAPYVAKNANLDLAALMLDELTKQLAVVRALDPTAKKATGRSADAGPVARLLVLLRGVSGRTDAPLVEVLLAALADHAVLARLAADVHESGALAVEHVAQALLLAGDPRGRAALAAFGAEAPSYLVQAAFVATTLADGPAAAFTVFSPVFLERPSGRAKAAKEAIARAEAIAGLLRHRAQAQKDDEDYYWYGGEGLVAQRFTDIAVDPRWLGAAVKVEDRDLILALAEPGHPELHGYLTRAVRDALGAKKPEPSYELGAVLEGLVKSAHPELVPLFVEVCERFAKGTGQWTDYMIHLNIFAHIPKLPPAAIEPLKALIPKMSDKILDGFAEPLDALVRKHAGSKN